MMHDIVNGAIESQADMEIVGQCANRQLEVAIRRRRANVVILKEEEASAREIRNWLLLTYPDLKVVVMRDDGRGASLFEFRHVDLVEPSPVALVDAIRAAVRHGADETSQSST
jgi:hypothetical protein